MCLENLKGRVYKYIYRADLLNLFLKKATYMQGSLGGWME